MPSQLPLAHPAYILRGHASAIHALGFLAKNRFLLSGDVDGWLILWDTTSKRPESVWRAHTAGVMCAREWKPKIHEPNDELRVLSHGRDHKLRVWQMRETDMEALDDRLPADRINDAEKGGSVGREPWLLYVLDISALNFCSFAMCKDEDDHRTALPEATGSISHVSNDADSEPIQAQGRVDLPVTITLGTSNSHQSPSYKPILLAAPNAISSGAIDIFHLPSSRRISTIPAPSPPFVKEAGMLMAVGIDFVVSPPSESGDEGLGAGVGNISQQRVELEKCLLVAAGYESGHVCVHVRQNLEQTSSSTIPSTMNVNSRTNDTWGWTTTYVTQPHSQPILSLSLAPSLAYFMTSGADATVAKHPFSPVRQRQQDTQCEPLQILKTGHAGQQGITVRDDGRVFATAGWDARVRVYSTGRLKAQKAKSSSMKELAVLKWHREGCYAVAFADISLYANDNENLKAEVEMKDKVEKLDGITEEQDEGRGATEFSALSDIRRERAEKAQRTHWLAAGGKDGKISMWDIY